MTLFFVPGSSDGPNSHEDRYRDLQRQVELRMGRPPRARRIVELWTRRGARDCITTVGTPDPIYGGIVTAIFDMGSHQPFVVFHEPGEGAPDAGCDVLGCNAYSVLEFDS
jgi:hypothetical protein